MSERDAAESRIGTLAKRVAGGIVRLQLRRPAIVVLVTAIATLVGIALASRLELRTRFDQLLPESQPSVRELRRVTARSVGTSNVFIVLEGEAPETLRAFGDALVPRLRAIGPPWVGSAEDGVQEARAFLMPRAGLFASVDQLTTLDREIDAQWDYQLAKGVGADLDDPPPPITVERIESLLAPAGGLRDRFPDGYYQSANGRALVVVARSPIPGGALEAARAALKRIREVVDAEHEGPRFGGVHVAYAGDLVTGLFEYGAVRHDLASVGAVGVTLVLAAIFLFFMRMRALVAMGVTIAAGLAWTFGVTELVIGHLNVATGFLFSIVAGNGINCGIIYMARYLEERRQGVPSDGAIETAHRATWKATLAAALAAAGSYGSLVVTDFRGFKHFALIGAAGMLLCWVATYTLTPAVLVLLERRFPFHGRPGQDGVLRRLRTRGTEYDAPFTWLVSLAPRSLALAGLGLALVSVGAAVRYVQHDPIEYNMRRLQNDLGDSSEIYRVSALARDVLGANTESGMVLLVDRLDQVAPLEHALEVRRSAVPYPDRPFEAVHALEDFVPREEGAKIPLLEAVAGKLRRARLRGFIPDADWLRITPLLPEAPLVPFGIADLPEDLARPFSESDGTRGRLVYIEPTAGKNDNDLHYLLTWADSFRTIPLPGGEVILGSGRAVIFADMLRAVLSDMPRAVILSFAMTMLAVVVSFRAGKKVASVLGALLVGVAWLGGLMALAQVRINFFNFIALPITFGIGVDYAVNIVQRHEEGMGVMRAMQKTGGAIVLCSVTTILGYLALLGSVNQAVRSLGLVSVLGEACCLLAAMLVLPSLLLWRDRAKARRTKGLHRRSEMSERTAS